MGMETSVYEVFEGICKKHPEKPALIYLGRVFTYGELEELVARFSSSLSRMGLEKGDRVMIYLPNTPQWIIAWLSILRVGAIGLAELREKLRKLSLHDYKLIVPK